MALACLVLILPLAEKTGEALFYTTLLFSARAEEAESMPRREWTVVFYLCGSVLESRHSCATENLREIASCYMYAVSRNLLMIGRTETPDTTPSGVNVVIETGGSREWHAQELGMEIRPDRLQRWFFHPVEQITLEGSGTFELAEELPLNSMADPETLADFIRWSAENYPAEKYALVLWDLFERNRDVEGICERAQLRSVYRQLWSARIWEG